jgi:hypothetical protein
MAAATHVAEIGRFPMRAVAAAVSVSRSGLAAALARRTEERASSPPESSPPADDGADGELLGRIKAVLVENPAYGYRFVTAVLNDGVGAAERVNHKRVYRVMRDHHLLLARHTGRPTRSHDGVVRTLKSDLRWCSDGFEIRCWNGEKVLVSFSLDCCDREVPAFIASTAHPTGETIRDLMAETIEARFGAGTTTVPHRVEWLSDNGPPYTARDTRVFGAQAGLLVVNTPAYSPESNGMAEAFVKSFKRTYVYVNRIPDAATVLERLPTWFAHYNERRPHSALGWLTPRAFRARRQHEALLQQTPSSNLSPAQIAAVV